VPGELLGSGGRKDVYTVQGRDDLVLAVLQEQNKETVEGLRTELRALEFLREEGFPTVEVVAETTYQGRDAVVLRRYAQGSKDVVKTIKKVPRIVGSSPLLNERSISDLRAIRQRLKEKKIKVDDLQFLIAEDGRMVIADPVDAFRNTKPSDANVETIRLLIKVAKRNVAPQQGGR
jgi:filamentous hemagglutinin